MPKRWPLFAVATLILLTGARAQSSQENTYRHTVFWSKTVVRDRFDDHFGLEVDLVYRTQNQDKSRHNLFSARHRESFRPWAHWYPNQDWIFSISPFAYFNTLNLMSRTDDPDAGRLRERRTTLMGQYYQRPGKFNLNHRVRFEYRDREALDSGLELVNYRIRYRFRVRYPQEGYAMAERVWYVRVFNEIAYQWGDAQEGFMFNQNRFYAGIGYSAPKGFRIELAYLNQYRQRQNGFEYDVSQGPMLQLYFDRAGELF